MAVLEMTVDLISFLFCFVCMVDKHKQVGERKDPKLKLSFLLIS